MSAEKYISANGNEIVHTKNKDTTRITVKLYR